MTNPLTSAFGTLPLINSQKLDVDFHPRKSNILLTILLLEQHYNNPIMLSNYVPTLG